MTTSGSIARRPASDSTATHRRVSSTGVRDRFLRNRRAVVGAAFVAALALMAVFAPLFAPFLPEAQDIAARYQPPGAEHRMGTDSFGRDVLSRALWASRISLSIGVVAVVISTVIAVAIGSIAGYYGQLIDDALMRVTEVFMSFPSLFLLIAIVAVFGNQVHVLIALLALTSWEGGARIVRGEVLSLRDRDFVAAARAIGAQDARIIVRHILPNAVSPVIVGATIRVPLMIMAEAALSYLGLGVQPPTPSWGNMVAEGQVALTFAWWASLFPGLFIFITVMSFNLMGDGLRDAFDPRMMAGSREWRAATEST